MDFVTVTDVEPYQPSSGVPTGWALSPIGTSDEILGVLALQIPTENIDRVMTGNQEWRLDGLGDSGEAYLVGDDLLMRSTSRLFVEDPEEYERAAVSGGTSPDVAARAVQLETTVLVQPVETPQVERALRGETGVMISRDYLGNEVLAAYAPVDLEGLGWVVIAELDTSEAFAPVNDFTRRLVLWTAAIIVVVTLGSLLLAQVFSRPIKRLLTGVQRVAAGELGAQVTPSSTDEFADLATAFNDMSRSLQIKQELLEAEQREHERLLLTLMPESVAQRYRKGEETISEEHQDVAVVFADIVGFDAYAATLDSATSLAQLNDIFRQFDEAAERNGVERVRTLRSGYLASCGLIQPRVDNALRAIDFAREMATIVERFNAAHDSSLALRAGVDTGKVTSGLVGRGSVAYDLWGDAVNLALRLQSSVDADGNLRHPGGVRPAARRHRVRAGRVDRDVGGSSTRVAAGGHAVNDLTSQPWFGWALVLVIGLPIVLIALTEFQGWLVRRGSAMAGPVGMLRNFALPAGALLVLFTKVWELDEEATWVRLLATVFGFLVIVLFLAALNVVLFRQAGTGTWRERMPSIFVDIARLVLIVTGLALLFSWVWGADVAGLFAALGVTSIILGFALQNAVGSIISGLLLLFEQPFRLGDWLDTGSTRGPRRRGQLAGGPHRNRQRRPDHSQRDPWPGRRSATSANPPATTS